MKRVELSLCMATEREVWPVFDGSARFDGIDLLASAVPAPELHLRQIRNAEFDASELGFGRLLIGDNRWVGIPVFPNRRMFHTRALVRRDSGIERPADLKGRRVGVPSFWMSAVMWSLGVFRDEYGVKPGDMEYWMERDPGQWKDTKATASASTSGELRTPAGVTIHLIAPPDNIATLILAKKLDAAIYYIGPELGANLVERSNIDLRNHPDIRSLFPDPVAEGVCYFRKTGMYPINHALVLKREMAERHPWLPANLYKGFQHAINTL